MISGRLKLKNLLCPLGLGWAPKVLLQHYGSHSYHSTCRTTGQSSSSWLSHDQRTNSVRVGTVSYLVYDNGQNSSPDFTPQLQIDNAQWPADHIPHIPLIPYDSTCLKKNLSSSPFFLSPKHFPLSSCYFIGGIITQLSKPETQESSLTFLSLFPYIFINTNST